MVQGRGSACCIGVGLQIRVQDCFCAPCVLTAALMLVPGMPSAGFQSCHPCCRQGQWGSGRCAARVTHAHGVALRALSPPAPLAGRPAPSLWRPGSSPSIVTGSAPTPAGACSPWRQPAALQPRASPASTPSSSSMPPTRVGAAGHPAALLTEASTIKGARPLRKRLRCNRPPLCACPSRQAPWATQLMQDVRLHVPMHPRGGAVGIEGRAEERVGRTLPGCAAATPHAAEP